MKTFAGNEWKKANRALKAAEALVTIDADSSVSRAYYAAFHAVTALFATEEQYFTKHSAIRSALHKELIKTGIWKKSLGTDYDYLMDLREIGDYGGLREVTAKDAKRAIDCAKNILEAVSDSTNFSV